jgi:hypothetical protein
VPGDLAHPGEFLVELAALHRGVLFALVVREDTGAHAGAERLRADEHAALHHQVGEAEAAQQGRLSALVGTGDHHERLAVGIHLVTDDPVFEVERQADVVDALRGERELARWEHGGEAGRLAFLAEPLMQVEAAEIEGELEPEHAEEALEVIGGLRHRLRDEVDPLAADLLQRVEAALVAGRDREAVAR